MAYCTYSDVEQLFGTANVLTWAKKSGTEDDTAARAIITAYITYSDAIINGRCRGSTKSFDIVFSPTPTIVKLISILLTAAFAYEGWGVVADGQGDGKHALTYQREWALKMLDQVCDGTMDTED
jgi:hypothetical protein